MGAHESHQGHGYHGSVSIAQKSLHSDKGVCNYLVRSVLGGLGSGPYPSI